MKTRTPSAAKHLDFLLLDLLCIELTFIISSAIRHKSITYVFGNSLYINICILLLITDCIYALLHNTHHNILRRDAWAEVRSVFVNVLILWALVGFYLYITQQGATFSRNVYVHSMVFTIPVMLLGRLILKIFVRRRLAKSTQLPNLLLLTTRYRAPELIRKFRERSYHSFHLNGVALIGAGKQEETVDGLKVVCTEDDLEEYLLTHVVDDVLLSLPYDYPDSETIVHRIVNAGVRLHINIDYLHENLPNKYLETIDGYSVITSWVGDMTPLEAAAKRAMDILGGVVGLVITGIATIFVGPAIYLASPGPIFFTQERVGRNGRRFKMVKFRSMYMDAEERKKELMAQNEVQDGLMFKMENDPRIIGSEKGSGKGIGNFIRKTSIDELPQFWNVLMGDMSLVGTRPPTVDEVEKYDLHHKIRLSMKPGITGLWQVSGRSEIKDFEEVVKLDQEYIENWTLELDVGLLLKTVKVVLKKEGAR